MSAIFVGVGFYLNEHNIKTRLNSFNLNSEEEQEKYDLKRLAGFIKKSFLFLGSSFLCLGLLLQYFVSEKALTLFLYYYPLITITTAIAITNGNRFKKKAP